MASIMARPKYQHYIDVLTYKLAYSLAHPATWDQSLNQGYRAAFCIELKAKRFYGAIDGFPYGRPLPIILERDEEHEPQHTARVRLIYVPSLMAGSDTQLGPYLYGKIRRIKQATKEKSKIILKQISSPKLNQYGLQVERKVVYDSKWTHQHNDIEFDFEKHMDAFTRSMGSSIGLGITV